MLKPRGREHLFAPAIFSHIFACCSLNFYSLSLCCLHMLFTLSRYYCRPILPIRLAYAISNMANFYVCCDKQRETRTQLMHRPTVIKCSPRNVPTPLVERIGLQPGSRLQSRKSFSKAVQALLRACERGVREPNYQRTLVISRPIRLKHAFL